MADSASKTAQDTGVKVDEARAWRIERYLELEFAPNEAEALADAKQTAVTGGKNKNERKVEWHTPLDWLRVKAALDSGKCDHALALQIFL